MHWNTCALEDLFGEREMSFRRVQIGAESAGPGTIVSTRRMKLGTSACSSRTCCRAACTTGGRVLVSPTPTICMSRPRLVSRDSETAGDRQARAGGDLQGAKRRAVRARHELCGGQVLVIRPHVLSESAQGYLLLNLGEDEGQEEVLEDKDEEEEESEVDERVKFLHISHRENGSSEVVVITNLKPSFKFLHLSIVSQRCGRSDTELEDVTWSWILFDVTAAVQE